MPSRSSSQNVPAELRLDQNLEVKRWEHLLRRGLVLHLLMFSWATRHRVTIRSVFRVGVKRCLLQHAPGATLAAPPIRFPASEPDGMPPSKRGACAPLLPAIVLAREIMGINERICRMRRFICAVVYGHL